MIIDYLKVLWPNFCMWIIMIFSEKFRERPVKDINCLFKTIPGGLRFYDSYDFCTIYLWFL